MAINPDNITTIRVDQLPEDTLALVNEFAHTNGTELKKATIQSLVDLVAAAVGAGSGVGFLPISVTDGQQLPDVPADPSFFLAGIGTYLNINGFPDLICTEELNAIMSLTDHWEIAVEIPINAEIGVQSVTGSAVDNTDPLNPIINSTGGVGTTPTLQEVTDAGNEIETLYNKTILNSEGLSTQSLGEYKNLLSNAGFVFEDLTTFNNTNLLFTLPTGVGGVINIPDVGASTETLALLSDIPTNTSDLINDGDDGNPFISLLDLPSNIIFYPTNVASDIGGYVKIVTSITDPSYNTTAVDVSTGAITTTNQLISSLATAPNIIVGNPGVFNITTIGNIRRTSGSGTASFYFQVYKRTSGGVETLIATSANTIPVLDSGTYVEFSSTAVWDDGIFLATDRVVMKYYANRIAGGSNPTYQFQFGGVTPVRTLVPIPLSVVPILTIDAVPTDGSTNAVSSNGVFDALNLKADKTSFISLVSPYSLTATTALQKIFNTGSAGNGAFNAIENSLYDFRLEFDLSISATSSNISFGFLGTATITLVNAKSLAIKSSGTTPTASAITSITSASATPILLANSGTNGRALIMGTLRVTTAGTVIPSIALGVSPVSASIDAGAFFKITKIGLNTDVSTNDFN
jgi:hypothetical protein